MNWNRRIVFKLGGSILLLFLIVLFPLGFVLNQIYSSLYVNDIREEIDQLSSRYANALSTVQDREILEMFVTLSRFTNTEVYIVDEEGTIVANSGVPGIVNGEKIKAGDLNALREGESLQSEYHYLPATDRFLASGNPVFNDDDFQGAIFVLSSLSHIDQQVTKVTRLVIFAGIGAFLLAAGFTFVLSRKLSAPLLEMEKATRKISKGDLQTRVSSYSNDEIGQLANAINDLAIELERYRNNRQQFFANISHELRTPITYLEGYANVLKEGLYESEAEKEQYLTIISDEAKRLIRLINDLFDLAKAEEGRLDMKSERLNLADIVQTVSAKVELRAHQKGLRLRCEMNEENTFVVGDRERMEQVLINLLENAIHYTEEGTITVTVYGVKDEHVHIDISDTGIGIPKKDLPYIFERFHRVEKSRSRAFGGTGLGLSIVKKLVELQDGTIHVSSEPGTGTTFNLRFPSQRSSEGTKL